LLDRWFGEFDRNLVAIEDRLGVYIAARGARIQIEGEPEAAARARDVLTGLYNRLDQGHDIDAGASMALIAMSGQPTPRRPRLDRRGRAAKGDDPDSQEDDRPRSKTQAAYMEALGRDEMIFALGPAGTGKTYLAVRKRCSS
jgi:phosphate starvation-inducible PhoH-like protein